MHACSIDEKRLYTRTLTDVSVFIYYTHKLIAKRQAINISVGGALIQSDDLGLPVNSLIDLMFEVDIDHPLKDFLFPVVVKRITDENFAVSFEVLDKATEALIHASMINAGK